MAVDGNAYHEFICVKGVYGGIICKTREGMIAEQARKTAVEKQQNGRLQGTQVHLLGLIRSGSPSSDVPVA